jgi:hypothetical protein
MKPRFEVTALDKTGWAEGPWMREPDLIEWRSDGYPQLACKIQRARIGALCGYVGVPLGHPWYGLDIWTGIAQACTGISRIRRSVPSVENPTQGNRPTCGG